MSTGYQGFASLSAVWSSMPLALCDNSLLLNTIFKQKLKHIFLENDKHHLGSRTVAFLWHWHHDTSVNTRLLEPISVINHSRATEATVKFKEKTLLKSQTEVKFVHYLDYRSWSWWSSAVPCMNTGKFTIALAWSLTAEVWHDLASTRPQRKLFMQIHVGSAFCCQPKKATKIWRPLIMSHTGT